MDKAFKTDEFQAIYEFIALNLSEGNDAERQASAFALTMDTTNIFVLTKDNNDFTGYLLCLPIAVSPKATFCVVHDWQKLGHPECFSAKWPGMFPKKEEERCPPK